MSWSALILLTLGAWIVYDMVQTMRAPSPPPEQRNRPDNPRRYWSRADWEAKRAFIDAATRSDKK